MCSGCVRENQFLNCYLLKPIMFICVCMCMDTPGRVDYGVGALASSSAIPAIAIHEVEGPLVCDEACEEGPRD